jgi:hypothetical protein
MPKQLVDPEGGVGGMSEEDIAWERARLRIGLGVDVPRERRWMYFAGAPRKGRLFESGKGKDESGNGLLVALAPCLLLVAAGVGLTLAFWWIQNGGMGAAGERAWTRAATGGSGPHPSTLTRDVNGNGNAGGGR